MLSKRLRARLKTLNNDKKKKLPQTIKKSKEIPLNIKYDLENI